MDSEDSCWLGSADGASLSVKAANDDLDMVEATIDDGVVARVGSGDLRWVHLVGCTGVFSWDSWRLCVWNGERSGKCAIAGETGIPSTFDLAVPTESGGCQRSGPIVLLWWLKQD